MARTQNKLRKVEVPESLEDNIYEIPGFIKQGYTGRGGIAAQVGLLAQALRAIAPSKAIIFNLKEFEDRFSPREGDIEGRVNYIKTCLRDRFEVLNTRHFIERDDDNIRVYFWHNNI